MSRGLRAPPEIGDAERHVHFAHVTRLLLRCFDPFAGIRMPLSLLTLSFRVLSGLTQVLCWLPMATQAPNVLTLAPNLLL